MPVEIERKFLVRNDGWRNGAVGQEFIQGYLKQSGDPPTIRIRQIGTSAFLTIKSQPQGIVRDEYEYPIPLEHAKEMLENLCSHPLIRKNRYEVQVAEDLWIVDVFDGENAGLVVAEIELRHPDQKFARPGWLGHEVTDDPRYSNSALSVHPFGRWELAM
jgi:CYTH domain-containing protein